MFFWQSTLHVRFITDTLSIILHSTAPSAAGAVPVHGSTGTFVAGSEERIGRTIPMPTFERRPSKMIFFCHRLFHTILWLDSNDSICRKFNVIKSPTLSTFSCWKIRFKNQVTICSDFLSKAMLWIKEGEMVDSMDELKSSRSIAGHDLPNFEMLDARIASVLNKIIENSHVKKEGHSEGTESPERRSVSSRKTHRFHDLRLYPSHWRSRYRS